MMIMKMVISLLHILLQLLQFFQLFVLKCVITNMHIITIIAIIADCFLIEWLKSFESRVVYELDYKKPVLYVISIQIQSILCKLPLIRVGDTGTIPHRMRNTFLGAPGDCRRLLPVDVVRGLSSTPTSGH